MTQFWEDPTIHGGRSFNVHPSPKSIHFSWSFARLSCRTGTCKKAEEGIQRWKHNLCSSILVIQCHTRVEGRRLCRLGIGETTWRVWMQQLAILCKNISSGRWWWRIQLLNNPLPPFSNIQISRCLSRAYFPKLQLGSSFRDYSRATFYIRKYHVIHDWIEMT